MTHAPEDSGPGPEIQDPADTRPKRDPYPRMILVCMGISAVLIVVIFAVILLDTMQRTDRRIRPVPPPQQSQSGLDVAPR